MSEIESKFVVPKRLIPSQENIWLQYAQLAADYEPLNLGQGFPDYPPPAYITEALAAVGRSDNCLLHQYTRDYGHPRLVSALAKLYSKLLGRVVDSENEILVTVGADEAIFCSIIGHVDVGDEVVIIEPFFDCYRSIVKMAGGVARFIPLRLRNVTGLPTSADWILDEKELESLFNEKTKVLILNNPHNPVGKVYTIAELQHIASLCTKWNVLCVADEVYEWIVYQPNKHTRIATLPGMWERTITIGSAGKTFSVTGWKIGWAYGPENLLHNLKMVHQNSVYTGNTPMQEVLAIAFETEFQRLNQRDCYFNSISKELLLKRDFMLQMLTDVGMRPTVPEGGYFVVADWTTLQSNIDLSSEEGEWKDFRFTKWMIKNVGVLGIPLSGFYSDANKFLGENFVRYCFFKKDETLKQAAAILENWRH